MIANHMAPEENWRCDQMLFRGSFKHKLDFQYIDLVLNFLSVISNFLLSQHPLDLSNRLMYFAVREPVFKYWIFQYLLTFIK